MVDIDHLRLVAEDTGLKSVDGAADEIVQLREDKALLISVIRTTRQWGGGAIVNGRLADPEFPQHLRVEIAGKLEVTDD